MQIKWKINCVFQANLANREKNKLFEFPPFIFYYEYMNIMLHRFAFSNGYNAH